MLKEFLIHGHSNHVEYTSMDLQWAYRNSWTLDLDSRRWTMDHGHYTLNTGLWTRDTANVCFRTESEHSF